MGLAALALGGLYVFGAVLMTGAAVGHATPPSTIGRSTSSLSMGKMVPAENSTGNDSSGGDNQSENDSGNSSACSGDGDGDAQGGDSQGDNNSQGNEDNGGNNSTDSSPHVAFGSENNTTGDDNGTENDTGEANDTGTGNDTGNETGDGNDTSGGSGNQTNCSSDPPVTFKALGLPSGSTWSVTAGSPPLTVTNTTVGHKGKIVFNVTTGWLNYSIVPPAGFGVAKVVGPGVPSQTRDLITNTTVLTVKFAALQQLTFSERGLPAGDFWQVSIWSSLPHGGPSGQSGSNTTSALGGTIVFTVVKGSWKFNITGVPGNFTAHPTHGAVGVAGHPVTKHLRFHTLPLAPLAPAASGGWSVGSLVATVLKDLVG